MKRLYTPFVVLILLLFSITPLEAAMKKANSDVVKTSTLSAVKMIPAKGLNATLTIKPTSTVASELQKEKLQPMAIAASSTAASHINSNISAAKPMTTDVYQNGFWQGLFYGVVFLLIAINFISFILFDEKIYLVYGSSLIAVAGFLFFSDGLLAFFDMHVVHKIEIVQASFFLVAAIASAIFGSYFLNLNTNYPKLKFIAMGVFSAAAIILISGWFLANEILAVVSNVLATAIIALYFVLGVALFSQKNYAKLYVIAMAFPILFIFDYLLAEPFNFSFLNVELVHIKGAVMVQILMLTYAILYRMREIKEENLIKQTELKIFLKRQEMTSRQKTEKHIEDVYLENVIMQYDLDGFEIKLLQYISEGKTNEKIARKLNITENRLEEMTNELYKKLEIREHIKEDHHLVASQPDYIYN